jgi:uncharacterized membrane protein YuzA (DUF378 family)
MRRKLAYLALILPVATIVAWGFVAVVDWPLIGALHGRIGREPSVQIYAYYLVIPAAVVALSLAHAIFCIVKWRPLWLVWQAALLLLILPYLVFYVGGV